MGDWELYCSHAKGLKQAPEEEARGWLVIASLGINEHRTFRQNILPASNHRLQVSFDPERKRFDYQLN